MKITKTDYEKRLLQIAIKWFIKHYTKGEKNVDIKDDIEHCGNPVIRKVYKQVITEMLKNIDESAGHQIHRIDEVVTFLLWILYKDTAYRQPAMWAFRKLLEMKDELMPYLEDIDEPCDWYVNRWVESKKMTSEGIERGDVPESGMSVAESFFVPELQQVRFDELEKMRKKMERVYK